MTISEMLCELYDDWYYGDLSLDLEDQAFIIEAYDLLIHQKMKLDEEEEEKIVDLFERNLAF